MDSIFQEISSECIECNICVKQCAFLKKYGTPKYISDNLLSGKDASGTMAFECSLCSLCTAVCPVDIDPREMFLQMRRHATTCGSGDFSKHKLLLDFEKRGISKRFSFYGLPDGCDTILFPGCALAGSRSERVIQLFIHLQNLFPTLGIVLDCCTKPSHDLGRNDFFQTKFSEMHNFLVKNGIKNILTACPSCYVIFTEYSKGITTNSVYDILAQESWAHDPGIPLTTVTVQDSCVARFENKIQTAVRKLIRTQGISYEEMKHHGKKTLCCGEGGGAHFVAPQLAGEWSKIRNHERNGKSIITYCAGCANFLGKIGPTIHLLDLIYDPAKALSGKIKVTKSPVTYLKRLLLKRWFRKNRKFAITWQRN